ncbi:hypothetical protein JYU29_07640 [Tianweitania sp. BSSL-BM11]|uniref:Uncharacterized protein n=1 Tax=Tianweitania aestuarii TaxID=2814886 RepID=A0ABS5RU38_9HYPH|nr:hypothetical protein [Tianweitania aestuarii]MBS9720555.1 hypothetical protein [Tianweitania aestuarii]
MNSHTPISRSLFDTRASKRLVAVAISVAVVTALISVAGSWLGPLLALSGHTEDQTLREIVIGNNVLAVPSNTIRFDEARVDGVTDRLDLYLHWPELDGYTAGTRDAFNNAEPEKRILFLTFEEATMSRDMTGRLEPIYRQLIEQEGRATDGGLTAYEFTETSGYTNEELVVGPGATPFVARCLTGQAAETALAPCERDLRMGEELSLTYRFPRGLLEQWSALDEAVKKRAQSFLRTPS